MSSFEMEGCWGFNGGCKALFKEDEKARPYREEL
jgi:hypothetical protein